MPEPRAAVVVVIAALSGLGALALPACLVDVDESLLARAEAARADGASNEAATSSGDGSSSSASDGGADATTSEGMPCGMSTCAPSRDVCCAGSFGSGDRRQGQCTSAADCASGDYWECMRPADCAQAGRPPVCCATNYKGGGFSKALCQTECTGSDSFVLCDPAAPSCTAPATCAPSSQFPDLFECR